MRLRSRVFDVETRHARTERRLHRFAYRAFYLLLDLDELNELGARLRLYRHNARAVLSSRDDGLLDRRPGPLRERIANWVPEAADPRRRILMLFAPRVLGWNFDPLRMYYVLGEGDRLIAALSEVENTYGDVHIYTLRPEGRRNGLYEIEQRKELFVSPFFGVDGSYRYRFDVPDQTLTLQMDLLRQGKVAFAASLTGKGREVSDMALVRSFLRAPFSPTLALPRILHHGLLLRFLCKIPARMRPLPTTERTVKWGQSRPPSPPPELKA